MTYWSPWLTDPNRYSSYLPTGGRFWHGGSTQTVGVDAAPDAYHPETGNHTSDVFFGQISSYLDITSTPAASIYTIGVDCTWLTDPATAFPPVENVDAIPTTLYPRWAGDWQWEDTHGTLYEPDGVTVTVAAVADDGGNPITAHPDIVAWLDDGVAFTTGASPHMQRTSWDQSTRAAQWAASAATSRYPGQPSAPTLTVPWTEVVARGYQIAVSFGVDLDIPTGTGPQGVVYKVQHNVLHLTWGDYLNPRFKLSLTTLPPLRQYPRDDALGGAPRQGSTSQSRSVQASARQGWANNYR